MFYTATLRVIKLFPTKKDAKRFLENVRFDLISTGVDPVNITKEVSYNPHAMDYRIKDEKCQH